MILDTTFSWNQNSTQVALVTQSNSLSLAINENIKKIQARLGDIIFKLWKIWDYFFIIMTHDWMSTNLMDVLKRNASFITYGHKSVGL